MRAHLSAAPAWVLASISGVLFGAGMTIWSLGTDGSWTVRIVLGVLAGAVFGVAMGAFFRREFGEARTELAALPIAQRRAVLRAAGRGPAPADPAVRTAALRQARRNQDLLLRRSRFNVTVFTTALVGYALLAVTRSPWWWFAFAWFAAFLAAQLLLPRRTARRIAVLSAPPAPEPTAADPPPAGPRPHPPPR